MPGGAQSQPTLCPCECSLSLSPTFTVCSIIRHPVGPMLWPHATSTNPGSSRTSMAQSKIATSSQSGSTQQNQLQVAFSV
ncbi:hypothetical protein L6164_030870 [Bauhinia variegata]|uniref:Uncharacterized protein n=1 Tax=Bauhinia variegata TaxID=167791 RepID=A0ACB9LDR2_BAUVA|nr:hypothetical protein L6164_030870 [Bauhinia variegata]